MPFKGTNKKAYKRASRGKTKEERSRLYYKEKKKLENHTSFSNIISNFFSKFINKKNSVTRFKDTSTFDKPKIESETERTKYVPTKMILDEIRDYRNSKIVSYITDKMATILVKNTYKNMSNDQKNIIRSVIAFIASETITKSLEKPLKVAENIKMFIKVNKIIYKVLMYFNDELNKFCISEYEIVSVKNYNSACSEYVEYLFNHPKIMQIEKRIESLDYLGKEVFVKVDKPLGSIHPKYIDQIFKLNYGYLPDTYVSEDEELRAYIIGVDEPIQEYTGIVKAIIIHKSDNEYKLVVCSKDKLFSKVQIYQFVQSQEHSNDIEIVM